MTFHLTFRPGARRELDDAALWYESERRGLGEQFLAEVEQALALVLEHPERFPDVHRGLRRIRVRRFPYSVIYRVVGNDIVVHAVFHARRNPAAWQGGA